MHYSIRSTGGIGYHRDGDDRNRITDLRSINTSLSEMSQVWGDVRSTSQQLQATGAGHPNRLVKSLASAQGPTLSLPQSEL